MAPATSRWIRRTNCASVAGAFGVTLFFARPASTSRSIVAADSSIFARALVATGAIACLRSGTGGGGGSGLAAAFFPRWFAGGAACASQDAVNPVDARIAANASSEPAENRNGRRCRDMERPPPNRRVRRERGRDAASVDVMQHKGNRGSAQTRSADSFPIGRPAVYTSPRGHFQSRRADFLGSEVVVAITEGRLDFRCRGGS